MKKLAKKQLVRNNPGWDKPVYFWLKIPAENRVCPSAQNPIQDATEIPT